jgi:hypothetical protein
MSAADSDPKKALENRLGALFFIATLLGYMFFVPQGIDLYTTTLESCSWSCSPPELGPVILLAVLAAVIPIGAGLYAKRLPEQSPARKSLFPRLVWLHTLYLSILLGIMVFLPFDPGQGGGRSFMHCFNVPTLLFVWFAAVRLLIVLRRKG